MNRDISSDNLVPEVPLELKLHISWQPLLEASPGLHQKAVEAVSQRLMKLLEVLGIPGRPLVHLTFFEEPNTRGQRFLHLTANGQLCRYADELLQRVYSYVQGVPLDSPAAPGHLPVWVQELFQAATGDRQAILVEFLSLACLEIVKKQAAVLLGPPQVLRYLASLPVPENPADSWPPEAAWLLAILRPLLQWRVSLSDKSLVAEGLHMGLRESRPPAEVTEHLLSILSPKAVEIQISQDYLRQLTSDPASQPQTFADLRDMFFDELGLRFPDFRLALREDLKPQAFAVKINHVTGPPWMGLPLNQYLVDEVPGALAQHQIPAQPIRHPVTGWESSLIDRGFLEQASTLRLPIDSPWAYLSWCCGADLRENLPCFLNLQAVTEQIDHLAQAFPALVAAVEARVTKVQLTRILRLLIAEEISLRNLRTILEALLDVDYIVIDAGKYIVLDPRFTVTETPSDPAWLEDPVNLAAAIRKGLKRDLSYKYSRGDWTMEVLLLDLQIEEILTRPRSSAPGETGDRVLEEADCQRILAAVREELHKLLPRTVPPPVLTTSPARLPFRELCALEFPRLPVLAYEDLIPDIRLNAIARITLES